MIEEWTRYESVEALAKYYFEDSYVLCVWNTDAIVEFTLLAVLTPEHIEYQPPEPGIQYCYRYARMRFSDCAEVSWKRRTPCLTVDPGGEADFGNIDAFTVNRDRYRLEGGWGDLEICAHAVSIELIDE